MKLTKNDIDSYIYQSYESVIVYLRTECFGEKFIMICEDRPDHYIVYEFLNCYKSDITHCIDYPKDKLYKDYTINQLPFYLVNWDIEIENDLYKIKMVAHPLYIDVWCKNIEIYKVRKGDYNYPCFEGV